MQAKIIELKQASVVLVEKPNEEDNDLFVVHGMEVFYNGDYIELPNADHHKPWNTVGILSDLTEEQFAECVDKYHGDITPARYKNYVYKKPNKGMQVNSVLIPWYNRATDAFYSLLESEKVYTSDIVDWNEAQSRTIDPSRTIILLKS